MSHKKYILIFALMLYSFILRGQKIEDFENSAPTWKFYTINSGSGFEIKSPPASFSTPAHSGNYCLVIGSDSGYKPNSYAVVESSVLDFSNVGNDSISFWQLYDDESPWDGVTLQYSDDLGTTWQTLGLENDTNGVNWYNHHSLVSNEPCFSGSTNNTWQRSWRSISPLQFVSIGVMFRFLFASDASGNFKAHCIDDIYLPGYNGFWTYDTLVSFLTLFNADNYCSVPATVPIGIFAKADTLACAFGDSVFIQVHFGDGTDTTINATLNKIEYNGFKFDTVLQHVYSSPLSYPVYFTSTLANGLFASSFIDTVYISANCNELNGIVYFDLNSNCVFDNNDVGTSGNTFNFYNNGTNNLLFSSDSSYSFGSKSIVPPCTLSLAGISPQITSAMNCPVNAIHSFNVFPNTALDFALNCVVGFDLKTSLHTQIVLGLNNYVDVFLRNQLCDTVLNGQVKLILPNGISLNSNIVNNVNTISGDTLIWNFSALSALNSNGLLPFSKIDINIDTSLVHLLDTIAFTVIAEPVSGDLNPLDNFYTDSVLVLSAFDPNNKIVWPKGDILNGTELTYTINFQNTGNASATNVNLLDSIDTNLDVASLSFVNSSHPMTLTSNENVLKFHFEEIMLPDSNSNEPQSHGFVKFKIRPFNNLNSGTKIHNKSFIYFDYNFPVITNETINTIVIPTPIIENTIDAFALVYPIPAKDFIKINSPNQFEYYSVNDCLGRKVQTGIIEKDGVIHLNKIPDGVYVLELKSSLKSLALKIFINGN